MTYSINFTQKHLITYDFPKSEDCVTTINNLCVNLINYKVIHVEFNHTYVLDQHAFTVNTDDSFQFIFCTALWLLESMRATTMQWYLSKFILVAQNF